MKSPSRPSRNSSSVVPRSRAMVSSPPGAASHAVITTVNPTLVSARTPLIASTAPPVRRAHDLGGARTVRVLEQDDPILRRRRRLGNAQHVVQQPAEVRLVERAGIRDEIAEVTHRALAEAGETVGRPRTLPAPALAIQSGEVKWWNVSIGVSAVLVARIQHAPVVVERRSRELALLGLDARPLERAAVGAEPEPGHERDIARVAVVVIAGIARDLGVGRGRQMLDEPAVVVDVAALDLVGRGRRAPQEPAGGKLMPPRPG